MVTKSINLNSRFWLFVLPSAGALLVSGIYKIVDGLFIGNYIGQDGLAAINMSWPLVGFTTGLGMMVGIGAGAAVSVEYGKLNSDKSVRYLSQLIWLLLLFSLFASAIFYFGGNLFIESQNPVENVRRLSSSYFKILSFSSVLIVSWIALPLIVRNLNGPVFATFSVIAGAFLNIGLDYIFIVRMGLELKGAAYAMVIGELLTIVMCIGYILSGKNPVKPGFKDLKINIEYCLDIIRTGLSSFIRYIYLCIVVYLYNKSLMQYGGNVYVASYAIIGYAVTFINLFTEGVNGGLQPLVSYYHGAGSSDNIRFIMRKGLTVLISMAVLFNIFVIFAPGEIAQLFTKTYETAAVASKAIRLNLCLITLDVLVYTAIMYLQAIKSAAAANFISVFNILIRLPFLFILPLFIGVDGIWFSTPVSNIVVSVVVLLVISRHIKKYKLNGR